LKVLKLQGYILEKDKENKSKLEEDKKMLSLLRLEPLAFRLPARRFTY